MDGNREFSILQIFLLPNQLYYYLKEAVPVDNLSARRVNKPDFQVGITG
jgi:hypothetical protein